MAKLVWDADADAALARAPFFVRPIARRKVEQMVRERGDSHVRLDDVEAAQARFRDVSKGKSEAEQSQLVPQPNQAGAEMVIVDTCHCELSNCPNTLLEPRPWKAAVEAWLCDYQVNERLRALVDDDKILFHHKLRISISGCPNGCSRPQIASFGLVGTVRPEFDHDKCTSCSACAAACPDRAITVDPVAHVDPDLCQGCTRCRDACAFDCIELSPPRALLMAGGKLGRHPHLAEPVTTLRHPDDLVAVLESSVTAYIDTSLPGERFADFWIRTHPTS